MKPLNELPQIKAREDQNDQKREKEILDFLASGAEFCELEMFDDQPKTMLPQTERGKYERIIRKLAPQTGFGAAYSSKPKRLKLYQRNYKLYCQRIDEKEAKNYGF